jgi:predicted nucleotidyltransferase
MTAKTLQKDIRKYLDRINYDKVILFGSRARGTHTKESDFDILLILKRQTTLQKKILLSTMLRKRFAQHMIDADILVKDKKDIEYLKDKTGSVVRNALLEGIEL